MADDPAREEADEKGQMSFWEHLEELRSRLIKSILIVGAGFLIAYLFVGRIQDFLIASFFAESKLTGLASVVFVVWLCYAAGSRVASWIF